MLKIGQEKKWRNLGKGKILVLNKENYNRSFSLVNYQCDTLKAANFDLCSALMTIYQ